MSHSLWLLTAACLASGVDHPSTIEDVTAPPHSMPAVVAAPLVSQGSSAPCPQKRCSIVERLHRRWQELCGHADWVPAAVPVTLAAKPSDCVKPGEMLSSNPWPAPGQCCTYSSGCPCPCPNPGAPSCAAVAPDASGKPSTQSWLSIMEQACPAAGQPCAAACPVDVKNPCPAPAVKNSCQAAANPRAQVPALLNGNDGMTLSPASAPAPAGASDGVKLQRPLAYLPPPDFLSKPEPVPVITDVQVSEASEAKAALPETPVSEAQAALPETPARKVAATDRLFDPPAMKVDPFTEKPDAPAKKLDNVIQTAAIALAPAGPDIVLTYLGRSSCAADYSRLTGQLSYVHTGGGLWVVRYAPLDGDDRYGGSVVLAPVVSMDSYKEGDLVSVTGEVLNDGQRTSKFLGGPLYRTTSVTLLDRPVRGAE